MDSNAKHFWSGKRVFLTGHTGFKGGWLSVWLTSLGATVKGFSLEAPTTPSLYACAKINDIVESDIGDIRNAQVLSKSMRDFNPDVVFHLAAQPLVRLSYDEPVETFSTNVMGTANVLESVRNITSVRAVVVVTSDKCYDNKEWHWGYREDEPLGGYDTYSASKACAEILTNSYRQSFFNKDDGQTRCAIASARAGNVIGGGDWAADRLVPDILRNLQLNEPVVLRNPQAIRPWQHVLEPLSGYMKLAELLWEKGAEFAQAWNFGPPETGAKTVQWMTEQLIDQWGAGSWELESGQQPHEATYLKLDCSKAREKLKWHPVWDPAEALAITANWHKAWLNKASMHQQCLDDIRRYSQNLQRLNELNQAGASSSSHSVAKPESLRGLAADNPPQATSPEKAFAKSQADGPAQPHTKQKSSTAT